MLHGRPLRVLCAAAVLVVAGMCLAQPLSAALRPKAEPRTVLPHLPRLRTTDPAIQDALERGREQSATMRLILETLDRSNVVVYLDRHNRFRDGEAGNLRFAGQAAGLRYVRVSLSTDLNPRELTVFLAHELTHAVEVAMAEHVVDNRGMQDLYCRIGSPGRFGVDTDAAQRVTERVSDELELLPFR